TTISVEGGFLFSNYTSPDAFAASSPSTGKIGTPGDKKYGGYGAISFGQDINPLYDWRISAAFNAFRSANGSASGSFPVPIVGSITNTITETDKFHFLTLDFDVGRRWENGDLQLRAFAGLRGLRTADDFSNLENVTVGKLGSASSSVTGTSHFTGIGPRIGLDMFYGSTFGVVGSVSGAVIWGIRDSNVTITSTVPVSFSSTQSDSKSTWVENLSGSLGLAWQFAPGASLVLGYRADAWWNIRDDFSYTGINFNNDKDIVVHGPFIRVTVR